MTSIGIIVDETIAQLNEEHRQLQVLEPGPEVVVGSQLWHECKAWRNRYFATRSRIAGLNGNFLDKVADTHLEMATNVLKSTPAPQLVPLKRTARKGAR